MELPEDEEKNKIGESIIANHRLDGEASPTLVLNKNAIAREKSDDAA